MWPKGPRRAAETQKSRDAQCEAGVENADARHFIKSHKPRLPLMPYGQDERAVPALVVAKEGEIAGSATRDHQFPKSRLYRPAEKRVLLQRFHG